jgi:hypothetical protein
MNNYSYTINGKEIIIKANTLNTACRILFTYFNPFEDDIVFGGQVSNWYVETLGLEIYD